MLNHRRDPMDELVDRLRADGFDVVATEAVPDTQRVVEETEPALALLNPLVLEPGGVELELLERLQRRPEPVPVILLVESVRDLLRAKALELPFRDFVLKPVSVEECRQRVALAMHTRTRFAALQQRAHELEGQVSVDFKTGLLSERYFKQIVLVEFKRARRHQMPLSLLLIDVDNFKEINDSTEYAFGDEVLRFVAQILKHNIRETDFAARYGGDEFVVLLPQTTPAEAVATAIRIRKKVASGRIEDRRYAKQVTISVGIDTFDGRVESSAEELRRRANLALREAKRRGKNQVWLYTGAVGNGNGDSDGAAEAEAETEAEAGADEVKDATGTG